MAGEFARTRCGDFHRWRKSRAACRFHFIRTTFRHIDSMQYNIRLILLISKRK
ncbi:hypothetical protein BSLA_01f5316 [Burkholderia stabilis]|nr:hypothetical protein BSLA_01f5316 [Burkholderia stabilis]